MYEVSTSYLLTVMLAVFLTLLVIIFTGKFTFGKRSFIYSVKVAIKLSIYLTITTFAMLFIIYMLNRLIGDLFM